MVAKLKLKGRRGKETSFFRLTCKTVSLLPLQLTAPGSPWMQYFMLLSPSILLTFTARK